MRQQGLGQQGHALLIPSSQLEDEDFTPLLITSPQLAGGDFPLNISSQFAVAFLFSH
jgi:hypothetical protein